MVLPAIIPPLISAAASIGSGYLASKSNESSSNNETKIQRSQRKLLDQLISSLDGNGPYSDLYSADESSFQKSFVDPAKSMFKNQIAPQIQQSYIASGQQRGTGLDDQLLRAGVDLDSILNQQYYQFQQDALNRKQNSINQVLNQNSGAPNVNNPTNSQNIMGAISGYTGSDTFRKDIKDILKKDPKEPVVRRGFENVNQL